MFDFTEFAQPLREAIRDNAERAAADKGVTIEFTATSRVSHGGPGPGDRRRYTSSEPEPGDPASVLALDVARTPRR